MNSYDFEKLSTDEKVTYRRLCSFKVPGMVDEYVNQLLNPNAALDPFEVRIQRMVDSEWQRRYSKKFTKYLKDAQLRYPAASLDKTIYLDWMMAG